MEFQEAPNNQNNTEMKNKFGEKGQRRRILFICSALDGFWVVSRQCWCDQAWNVCVHFCWVCFIKKMSRAGDTSCRIAVVVPAEM